MARWSNASRLGRIRRKALAEWMVRHPYFAEAAVNRIWSYFLRPRHGRSGGRLPFHESADASGIAGAAGGDFRSHNHDLRHLIRTIVTSRTYQTFGRAQCHESRRSDQLLACAAAALDAEVLLDAICDVTGVPEVFTTAVSECVEDQRASPAGNARDSAARAGSLLFAVPGTIWPANRLTLPERNGKANLAEALHMLAGPAYNEKLDAPQGRSAAAA